LTQIECDGTWETDITTGGRDSSATQIAAFLVPVMYNPPLGKGGSLPTKIREDAIAELIVTR